MPFKVMDLVILSHQTGAETLGSRPFRTIRSRDHHEKEALFDCNIRNAAVLCSTPRRKHGKLVACQQPWRPTECAISSWLWSRTSRCRGWVCSRRAHFTPAGNGLACRRKSGRSAKQGTGLPYTHEVQHAAPNVQQLETECALAVCWPLIKTGSVILCYCLITWLQGGVCGSWLEQQLQGWCKLQASQPCAASSTFQGICWRQWRAGVPCAVKHYLTAISRRHPNQRGGFCFFAIPTA